MIVVGGGREHRTLHGGRALRVVFGGTGDFSASSPETRKPKLVSDRCHEKMSKESGTGTQATVVSWRMLQQQQG